MVELTLINLENISASVSLDSLEQTVKQVNYYRLNYFLDIHTDLLKHVEQVCKSRLI